MDFQQHIMKMPIDEGKMNDSLTYANNPQAGYAYGFRDAKFAAAEIANEADLMVTKLQDRVAKLEAALHRIATETQGLRLKYRREAEGESTTLLISEFAEKALEDGGVPYDIGVQCLEALKPLDVYAMVGKE